MCRRVSISCLAVAWSLSLAWCAHADEPKPVRWADALAEEKADLEKQRAALSAADRAVLSFKLSGQELPSLLQGKVPDVATVGSLPEMEFMGIASGAGQFRHDDVVVFVRGIDLNRLVPGRLYRDKRTYVVDSFVEYTTVLGAKRRAPLLKKYEPAGLDVLQNAIEAHEGTKLRLREWFTPERKFFALYSECEKTGDFVTAVKVTEFVKVPPVAIPVDQLDNNALRWIRTQPDAAGVRFLNAGDVTLAKAGHIYRPRPWATEDGKFSVEASFVSAKATTIKLRRADDGREISIDSKKLSREDRLYLGKKEYAADRLERAVATD